MSLDERFASFPVEARAAFIGAVVGTAAWFLPDLVGGGDPITQAMLSGGAGILFLSAAFCFGSAWVGYHMQPPSPADCLLRYSRWEHNWG